MILYHVSYNTEKALDYTFIPRVPESIAFDEDDQIKRICFADSIKIVYSKRRATYAGS